MLVHLRLAPRLLLGIENEDVVHDPLLAVALSAAKNDQVLSELGRRVTVTSGRGLRGSLIRIDFNRVPGVLL